MRTKRPAAAAVALAGAGATVVRTNFASAVEPSGATIKADQIVPGPLGRPAPHPA